MKTKSKSIFRRFLFSLKVYFYLIKKSMALSLAISFANLKQKAFNRRFFVILNYNDRLITVCNTDIKRLKQKGYLSKNLTHYDILEKSFYYTPISRNNSDAITPEQRRRKRHLYLRYMKAKKFFNQPKSKYRHANKRSL